MTTWEAWVQGKDDENPDDDDAAALVASDAGDGDSDESGAEDTSEAEGEGGDDEGPATYPGYNPDDAWANWGDRGREENTAEQDFRWWTTARNSSTSTRRPVSTGALSCALFLLAIASSLATW